ncbi:MAG: hypothetical protein LBV30_11025 [Propionibacteriaceae bacterium]|jgi:hypothetical protein|nr:hypothetical protein [Propionibacteriaceae bacterium]
MMIDVLAIAIDIALATIVVSLWYIRRWAAVISWFVAAAILAIPHIILGLSQWQLSSTDTMIVATAAVGTHLFWQNRRHDQSEGNS